MRVTDTACRRLAASAQTSAFSRPAVRERLPPNRRSASALRCGSSRGCRHVGEGVGDEGGQGITQPYLTPSTFSFSLTSDRDRLKGLPGAWLVSNAVNISYVQSALPGLDAARLLTG